MEEEEEEDDDGDDGDEVREVGVVDPDEVGCWCGTAEREGQEFDGNWIVCDECAEPAVWHHVQCNFPGIRAADLPEEEWVCPLCFSGRGVVEAKRAVREVCLDLTTISGLEIEPTKVSRLYGELKLGVLNFSYFTTNLHEKPAAVLEAVRRVRSLLVDTLYVKAGGDVGAVEHVSAPRLQAALDALLAEDAPTDVSTDAEGTRIVTVGGLPCPCGGTHVASSGAIGAVTIEGLKKKGSGKSTALRVSYSMSD